MPHNSAYKMLVIGLAGGIASGKSFVASCFESLGAKVIDADRVGHAVLDQTEIQQEIVARWGKELLTDDKINRRELARIVFESDTSATALQELEKITHPAIRREVERQLDSIRRREQIPAVVLDAPVMFRAGWADLCDRIVFVDVPVKVRQQRAIGRGWDYGELVRRESFQTPVEEKQRRSTDFIDNSGHLSETRKQVEQLWRTWRLPLEILKQN